jgi:2-[(L-alanin-3-ylcarbamoyl)methyl]-2-hydroxybutanedioate decarboxylase
VTEVPERVAAALMALPQPVCAYVYDASVLRERARAVRAALPTGAALCYAVKANGDPRVLAALAPVVDGFDVASGGELALALAAAPDGLVVFAGPAKTDSELAAAVTAGAVVNVESLLELHRLAAAANAATNAAATNAAAKAAECKPRLALRVNRAGPALPGSHLMAGAPTPFGLDEADLPAAVALARDLGLDPLGFHLHTVSNNLDAAAHAAYVADAVAWSEAAAARLGVDLRYINVGGGFGVDYTGGREFDLAELTTVAPDPRLVFEPGRYLAAGAGRYAAEVQDLKRVHGRWFAVLRGGTHHFRLPAAWGYSHPFAVLPVDRWPYGYARPAVRDAAVTVTGELCTPRDVLARDVTVDRLRVGDVLVFGNAGAYGWDISHHDFLRHPHPDVVWLP